MKLLFAHDNTFDKFGNTYYCTFGFSNNVLSRYTSQFEEVSFICRVKHLDLISPEKEIIEQDNLVFIETSNYKDLKNISKYFEVRKQIETEVKKTDVLIARLPSSIGLLAVSFAKKHNKPYLVEVVGNAYDAYYHHSFKGKILAKTISNKNKKAIIDAPLAVYVTEKHLQEFYPNKNYNIACSDVDLNLINEGIHNNKLEKLSNVDTKKIKIGTIGGIDVKYKGHRYIVEAVSVLNNNGYNITLEIVGSGDSSYLEKIIEKYKAEKYVKIIGAINHEEINTWLLDLDLYTQTSLQEGLPRVILEAYSCGIPVIASDVGGVCDVVDTKNLINPLMMVQNTIKLISNIDNHYLVEESYKNYNIAKKYQNNVLSKKRVAIFNMLKEQS